MKMLLMIVMMLVLGACSHGNGKKHDCNCDKKKAALAAAVEYDGHCAMGLCLKSQKVKCDPTITAAYKGKNYCFSSEKARANFMRDVEGNVKKSRKAWDIIDRAPRNS